MPTSLYNFQYVPLTGRLPGKSFVSQTEQAINGLAQYVYENSTNYEAVKAIAQKAEEDSSSALEYSEQALDKAQTALETVGRAYIKTTSAVDLDDYYDSELLLILSTESTNLPASISGYLTVMSSDTHDYCMQVYIGIDGSVYKRTATISNDVPTFGAWSETPITLSSLQTILSDYAKVNASNIGVNAQSDNSIAWGNAIGGGEIAEDEQRLITGGTIYPLSQNVAQNTSNIATNTADIVQNTGGISANSKRITNIEKLLQGNLYDYQTDSTSAYTKSVPSGAMPYAGLEKVGGKTVVWNQIVTFSDSTATLSNGVSVTITKADLSIALSGTANANDAYVGIVTFPAVVGHKYAVWGVPANMRNDVYLYSVGGTFNTGTNAGQISTADATSYYFRLYVKGNITYSSANKVYPKVMDLTLAFGSGNEPSTIEDVIALFPADYYAYNAGELLSAGVTSVDVRHNLADYSDGAGVPSDTTATSVNRVFEIGKYYAGMSANNLYRPDYITVYSVTQNSIVHTTTGNGFGIAIPFNCVGGAKYTFLCDTSPSHGFMVSWYGVNGNFINFTNPDVYSGVTLTAPNNAVQGCLVIKGEASVEQTYSNIRILSPAIAHIIPAEIQALEGYGWSAGSVYNYVDYERKVFVQNVGKIILNGSNSVSFSGATLTVDGEIISACYTTSITDRKDGSQNMVADQNYLRKENDGTTYKTRIFYSGGGATSNRLYFLPPDLNTQGANSFKTWLTSNNMTIYYELATPIEVDISQYLTDDNLINVEAGGTLTFLNQNGTDYQIPVPSEEEYMIDLQSAL